MYVSSSNQRSAPREPSRAATHACILDHLTVEIDSLPGLLSLVVIVQGALIIALLVLRARGARAERALRESEERFRVIADRAPVMMWTSRADATLDYLNHTCSEFSGLPLEQLLDQGWLNAVHPDDRDPCMRIYVPAVQARVPFDMEFRLRRADGAYRWAMSLGVPRYRPDGSYLGYLGSTIDITERKESENAVRENEAAQRASYREIQRLAGSLITAQDAERARIARDLHDGISQQLAALSIALSGLKRRVGAVSNDLDLQGRLSAVQERAAALAEGVRNLSHDLHPDVLKHTGLTGALSSHCTGIAREHPVAVACTAEGDFDSLDIATAHSLYRIAQEALHNIVKHAEARQADVRLRRLDGGVELTISDDGKGFDIAGTRAAGNGLGLLSINERVRLAGGTLSVVTEWRKGTQIRVRVPNPGATPAAGDAFEPSAAR
jgi:PAS domain S-box-containing protein